MHRVIQGIPRQSILIYPMPGEEGNPVPALARRWRCTEYRGEVAMMRQLGPGFYDSMHAKIDQSVTRTRYDGLFHKLSPRSILEVGCGSGFLAKMILQEYNGIYSGFDFSAEAIRNANYRTGRPELFLSATPLIADRIRAITIRSSAWRRWNTSIAILRLFDFGATQHGASAQSPILTMQDMSVPRCHAVRSATVRLVVL
jgi:SAM-dependent methyltransferase